MIQLIAFIIFLVSLSAAVIVLYKKMPVLAGLPQNGHHGLRKPEVIIKIEKKIRERHFHLFQKQMLLHRILSKTRVWILRIERKIDEMLHGIRQNAQELDKKIRPKK